MEPMGGGPDPMDPPPHKYATVFSITNVDDR